MQIRTKYAELVASNSGNRMISFKIQYDEDELAEDLKIRPCIELPADWTNERVECARKATGAICVELWGNRRMLRANPEHVADLRGIVIGRREDPSEQAWTAGPWPNWMSTMEAENFLRNIPWEIEIVLGTQ